MMNNEELWSPLWDDISIIFVRKHHNYSLFIVSIFIIHQGPLQNATDPFVVNENGQCFLERKPLTTVSMKSHTGGSSHLS